MPVSGVETAGLVLASLPFIIEAAKRYKSGVSEIRDVVSSRRYNEKLQEFYEDFYTEVVLVNENVKVVVNNLPGLSEDRRDTLRSQIALKDWTPDQDVATALQSLFGGGYESFEIAIKKIMRLLGRIVDGQSTREDGVDKDEDRMYQRLKDFYEIQQRNDPTQASSTLLCRLKFRTDARKRKENLANLHRSTKKLERLIHLNVRTQEHRAEVPSSQSDLMRRLDQLWSLARFSLEALSKCISKPIVIENDFDILIGTNQNDHWCKGVFSVRRTVSASQQALSALSKICEAANKVPHHSLALQVLIEEQHGLPHIWQLQPRPSQLLIPRAASSKTLHTLLTATDSTLGTKMKCKLAFMVALSTLGLQEETWLRQGLSKENISFFKTAEGLLDSHRPYLTTYFDQTTIADLTTASLCHRNPRLLALAILLLEIELAKPIQAYRTTDDLKDGQVTVFTDVVVAQRILQTLECSDNYHHAVQSCLSPSWLPGQQSISLEDPTVRKGLYIDVIEPLRKDLEYLTRQKF